jgi:hypothetical protein
MRSLHAPTWRTLQVLQPLDNADQWMRLERAPLPWAFSPPRSARTINEHHDANTHALGAGFLV